MNIKDKLCRVGNSTKNAFIDSKKAGGPLVDGDVVYVDADDVVHHYTGAAGDGMPCGVVIHSCGDAGDYVDVQFDGQVDLCLKAINTPEIPSPAPVYEDPKKLGTYIPYDLNADGAPIIPTDVMQGYFYKDGDKTKTDAAQLVADAIANGQALAITDGAGNPIKIFNPVKDVDLEEYVNDQGGLWTDNCRFVCAKPIAICCEEEVCGVIPEAVRRLNTDVNIATGEYIRYEVGFPFEVVEKITDFSGNPVNYQFGTAWCSGDRIFTVQPPRLGTQQVDTVTEDKDCCPAVCYPECVKWRRDWSDIDRDVRVEVLNPQDGGILTMGGAGTWVESPANVWTYTIPVGNLDSNGWFRVEAACDKPVEVSWDALGGDCFGTQVYIWSKRAALLRYVCDPSVVGNRVRATLATGATVTPSSVTIP